MTAASRIARRTARRLAVGIARLALVGAATVAALGGCAAPGPRPDLAEDASLVTSWRGRFALTMDEGGAAPRQDSALGSFVLRRTRAAPRDALRLELYSPLGQTVATASTGAEGARIELADGRRFEGLDADALAEQTFGWRLPLSRLTDWLEGRADESAERDVTGRLLRATDANWRVTVTDWDDKLPRRLDLQWPVTPVDPPRSIRLRLAVEP